MFDSSPAALALVAAVALVASITASITGTGGAIILLPVLVSVFGIRDAVPAYTVGQLIGNLSRVLMNRAEIQFRVVLWFSLGAIPMAILGGLLFARTGESLLTRILGAFLLFVVVWRRARPQSQRPFPIQGFVPVGGTFAMISALAGSGGPFVAPFFLAYGLVRGAYIGTEALASAVMHVTKIATYGASDVMSFRSVTIGLTIAPVMVLGTLVGKRLMARLSEEAFVTIVEAVLVVLGSVLLIRG